MKLKEGTRREPPNRWAPESKVPRREKCNFPAGVRGVKFQGPELRGFFTVENGGVGDSPGQDTTLQVWPSSVDKG